MSIDTPYGTHGSYIEWGAIIAGAVVACAISAVLVQFGAAVGLTQISTDLSTDQNITPGFVLGTGIWLLWIQLMASLAGGYLAGRMRQPVAGATEHESDMRDGVHGLLVWATATLAVMIGAYLTGLASSIGNNPADDIARTADVDAMRDRAVIIFAFGAAATSLVSGVVSWWAATIGGNHRDTRADHTRYFTFRVLR
jgi:hypothetical protein